jgi:hypothetical protein
MSIFASLFGVGQAIADASAGMSAMDVETSAMLAVDAEAQHDSQMLGIAKVLGQITKEGWDTAAGDFG